MLEGFKSPELSKNDLTLTFVKNRASIPCSAWSRIGLHFILPVADFTKFRLFIILLQKPAWFCRNKKIKIFRISLLGLFLLSYVLQNLAGFCFVGKMLYLKQ